MYDRSLVFEWRKENGSLPQNKTYQHSGTGLLWIKDVQDEDAGTYICTVSDGILFVTENTRLDISVEGIRELLYLLCLVYFQFTHI